MTNNAAHYNQAVPQPLLVRVFVFSALVFSLVAPSLAQSSAAANAKEPGGRVLLVLPFDNRSGQPNLAWIGNSFPDTLNQRLSSAGFLTITRDDRQFALDHLGLPPNFKPTRATTIRIAQTLDADYVIVGSYKLNGGRIQVQAQVLEVNGLTLSQPLLDSSELARLLDVENAMSWKVARQIDPRFSVAQQTFLSASSGVRLSAFENYIRGTDAPTPQERVKRLQTAVSESPNYAAAQLALGKELYTDREFDSAAIMLAKVPKSDRLSLEASFYLGLSRFNAAKYGEAEAAFAFLASRLPLPEVVNDQGVAQARQGKDARALFQRAVNADPNDPDYHYNLAVQDFRHGDFASAQREVDATLKLKAADVDATELRTHILAGRATAPKANGVEFEPTERLRRTYSEASFRQAAFQLDQMRAMRLATQPPAQQAAEYTQAGSDYLMQGLLPEAEQEFHAALSAEPGSAAAHAGLARIREQSGDVDEARNEAQASLAASPSVEAYLVLARLDLGKNNLAASADSVSKALKLEPASTAAQGIRHALQLRGQNTP